MGFCRIGVFRESKADSERRQEEMTNRDLNDAILLLEEILREGGLKSNAEAAAVGRTHGVLKRVLRQRLLNNVEKNG